MFELLVGMYVMQLSCHKSCPTPPAPAAGTVFAVLADFVVLQTKKRWARIGLDIENAPQGSLESLHPKIRAHSNRLRVSLLGLSAVPKPIPVENVKDNIEQGGGVAVPNERSVMFKLNRFCKTTTKFSYYQGNCCATNGLQSDFGFTGAAGGQGELYVAAVSRTVEHQKHPA